MGTRTQTAYGGCVSCTWSESCWLRALPWCADAAANPTRARSKVRGGSKCSRGFLNGLGEELANDGIDESTKEQAVVVAPRRLLAFVDPEAQEEFRRQVMYGCC